MDYLRAESRIHSYRPRNERSAFGVHLAASAAHRFLQAASAVLADGGSDRGLRAAELLPRAGGPLPPRGRSQDPLTLEAAGFRADAATPGFTLSGFEPGAPVRMDPHVAAAATSARCVTGRASGPPDVKLLGGCFIFGSTGRWLARLAAAGAAARTWRRAPLAAGATDRRRVERTAGRSRRRPLRAWWRCCWSRPCARAPTKMRLQGCCGDSPTRQLRERCSNARRPGAGLDGGELARAAALSRSAFFERFTRTVGLPPTEYLRAWRMAVAKDLLRKHATWRGRGRRRVGYGSASTFSTAFTATSVSRPAGTHEWKPARPGDGAPAAARQLSMTLCSRQNVRR